MGRLTTILAVPAITLTTDFGLSDHYVGVMKGVILSRYPTVCIVDITHEIPPFSLYAAAYAIEQAAAYFPAGTIHVVVVDPGVGTPRKPLLLEAMGQIFIAPDNGVLSLILERDNSSKVREITNRGLWLTSLSNTFHGRDVFAPVAAAIAAGALSVEDVGPVVSGIEILPELNPLETERGVWRGRVLSIDRFGNIITNFKTAEFAQILDGQFAFDIGSGQVTRVRRTFAEAEHGECFVYFGSSGYLEIAINQKSAAQALKVSAGVFIKLS